MTLTVIDDTPKKQIEISAKKSMENFKKSVEVQILDILHKQNNSVDLIAKQVVEKLHKSMEDNATEVLLKLLGFDNKWGGWQIDHCNGRAGNSEVGVTLKSLFSEVTKNFVLQFKEESMKLTKTEYAQILKIMKKEFINSLESEAIRAMREKGKTCGRELVEEIFAGVTSESALLTSINIIDALEPN